MGKYQFDSELFGKLFDNQSDNYTRLSGKMDVDWRTIMRWREGSDIHATNIVKVCNLFHINPLSFFPCEGEQNEMARDAKCHFAIRGKKEEEKDAVKRATDMEAYREARRDLTEEYERRIERMECRIEELQEKLTQERIRSRELEVRLEMAATESGKQAGVKIYVPQSGNGNMVSEEM